MYPKADRIWNWPIPERKLNLKFEIVLNLPTPGCIHSESDRNRGSNILGEAQSEAESWHSISWVSGTTILFSRAYLLFSQVFGVFQVRS